MTEESNRCPLGIAEVQCGYWNPELKQCERFLRKDFIEQTIIVCKGCGERQSSEVETT